MKTKNAKKFLADWFGLNEPKAESIPESPQSILYSAINTQASMNEEQQEVFKMLYEKILRARKKEKFLEEREIALALRIMFLAQWINTCRG